MNKYKRFLLTLVAIIGFLTSVKLTYIFYESNYNPYALNSFCTINDFIDCDGVAKTPHAQFFGVPLAVWGLILYTFILWMTYADKLAKTKLFRFMEVFKNPLSYLFAVGLFAFCVSMTLACISIFEIKKICILCFFTYILNLIIAAIALYKEKSIFAMIKDCFVDFWSAIQIKKYLIAFIAVVIAGIGVLTYTSTSYVLAPHIKKVKEFEALRHMKTNPYKVSGNVLGDKDGKVRLYIFTDYQCPACYMMNITIHKIAKKLKNVHVIHKNFPLDKECNPMMNFQMHPKACLMSKYSIAAGYQDKYWDMNDILFTKKPRSEEDILKLAKEEGFDVEKLKADANSAKVKEQLQNEIKLAMDYKLNATPVLMLGLRQMPGVTSYDVLEKILIEAGAKKR